MTYFERYFARLDGPDPHSSLELVSADVEFSIQWASGSDHSSKQFVGGLDELRAFIDAGDTRGWAHHILHSGRSGEVEFALGETRWEDSGQRIGTFLAVAELDDQGRMRRYLATRTPALAFDVAVHTADPRGSRSDPE
ncbi:MAG: hypothetical protein JO130_08115 [Solirubrobacterales bacterium]|nr:hypothetical protein [Solirubrobacterales bacterium]